MIIEMSLEEFKAFWPTFKSTLEERETYSFEPDLTFEEGYELWCKMPHKSFVAKEGGTILGSYYIKPNAAGPGSHVCNCGYIVTPEARGKGIARKMCLHSQKVALELGYQAMQFNAVVSTNEVAISLWKKLGFAAIGTVPKAFNHGKLGYVDTLIMHKQLN